MAEKLGTIDRESGEMVRVKDEESEGTLGLCVNTMAHKPPS